MKAGSSIDDLNSNYQPGEKLIAYAATKAAIVSMTKSIAKLAGGRGIRVNAGGTWPVWTPLIPSTMPQER